MAHLIEDLLSYSHGSGRQDLAEPDLLQPDRQRALLEKVFGVFQRLHNDEAIPGTGIGLALVQKAATMLGANVRLESVVGEGCTFHVDLPRNRKQ
jgi:signal transduction histidine kinase